MATRLRSPGSPAARSSGPRRSCRSAGAVISTCGTRWTGAASPPPPGPCSRAPPWARRRCYRSLGTQLWAAVLTCTSRGLRTVRTGYMYVRATCTSLPRAVRTGGTGQLGPGRAVLYVKYGVKTRTSLRRTRGAPGGRRGAAAERGGALHDGRALRARRLPGLEVEAVTVCDRGCHPL